MTPPKIRISTEAVTTARKEFRTFGKDLEQVETDVPTRCSDITSGAGEFASELQGGADVFEASWLMVLDVSAASARTVAINMGSMTLDLSELDRT